MKISVSIQMVWQLAAREAIAAQFNEIQPEHFLEALLKFSELPADKARGIAPAVDVTEMLTAEVQAVRGELEMHQIESTRVRRMLRDQLGKGNSPYDGGDMHREQASRDIFDSAARLADDDGSDTLTANHLLIALLNSPTPAIEKVLEDAAVKPHAYLSRTPLLDQYGEDPGQALVDWDLFPDGFRLAEAKALMRALSERDPKSILLITDDGIASEYTVIRAAQAMAKKDCPTPLKRKRFVTLRVELPTEENPCETLNLLARILAEGATLNDVILVVPGIKSQPNEKRLNDWGMLLKGKLATCSAICVCVIAPEAYHKWIEKDSTWKHLVRVMWIYGKTNGTVPSEL